MPAIHGSDRRHQSAFGCRVPGPGRRCETVVERAPPICLRVITRRDRRSVAVQGTQTARHPQHQLHPFEFV